MNIDPALAYKQTQGAIMQRRFLPFLPFLPFLLFLSVGKLAAVETAALPAEAAGFVGVLVGTMVGYSPGILTIKVSEITPGSSNKAIDANKLKDTEVAISVAYDVKRDDGKWGKNPEHVAAAKALLRGSKVAVEVKSLQGGKLVMTAPPKGEGDATPKPKEAEGK